MKITRVQLTNFAQHESLDQPIDENIVGIVGRNGSGKSNFASSISMAITGEFGRKRKKDLITFGKTKGGIHVEGVIRNTPFQVSRALHDNTCLLKYGGEEIDGADAVNAKLLELLGCDKSFLPNMVFVSQTDILGVLFGRTAERNKMLQKFFGLEKAAKLDLLLGQWKSNISYPAVVDEAQSRAAIESLREMIAQNSRKMGELEEEEASARTGIDGVDVEKIKENHRKAIQKEQSLSLLEELNADCSRYAESLKALVKPEDDEKSIESKESELASLRTAIGALDNLIDILKAAEHIDAEHATACPICDSGLDSGTIQKMAAKLEIAVAERLSLAGKAGELKESIQFGKRKISAYSSEHDRLEGAYRDSMEKIKKIERLLATEKYPAFDPDVYAEGIRGYQSAISQAESLAAQRRSLEATNGQLEMQIRKHEADLETAKKVQSVFKGTKIHESRVSRIRDVFRHDGISGRYVNAQMNAMCESINQYLLNFGAVYRVSVGEDNEFMCDFGDKVRPAGDLSCGQKVVLSLAFRFAACEVFSTGVDLIVLDEPTTWLDRETISNFKNIIESISELSDSHNLQVLLVTHERSMMPYFRQTIEF